MSKWLAVSRFPVCFLAAAAVFLTACERPNASPLAAAPLIPTAQPVEESQPVQEDQAAQVEAVLQPVATPQPIQVNVTVLMPTPVAPVQGFPESLEVVLVTPTPDPNVQAAVIPNESAPAAGLPSANAATPFPEAYYVGWTWTESIEAKPNDRTIIDLNGAQLRDRPAPEGEKIALVYGLSEVIVAGESYCGYTPVMTHRDNLLAFISPQPQIFRPISSVSSQQPGLGLRAVDEGTTSGWVYLGAVELLDDTATAGEFGLTLRQEPCRYGKNLGFIPAWAEMQIVGNPSGDYVPIRISNSVIQLRDMGPGQHPMTGLEPFDPPYPLPTATAPN